MESIAVFLALLMSLSATASDTHPICELKDIYGTKNELIDVMDITEGCWTGFLTADKKEVHIISLQFTQKDHAILSIHVQASAILIFTNATQQPISAIVTAPPEVKLGLYVTNGTDMTFHSSSQFLQSAPNLKGVELLNWATKKFGGVTSFTTVQDPANITVTGLMVPKLGDVCKLRMEYAKQKTVLSVYSSGEAVRSCRTNSTRDELHIINIPDEFRVDEVKLEVTAPEVRLVLRGPSGIKWNVTGHNVFLLSNNVVQPNTLSQTQTDISGDASDIRQKALSHYSGNSISSYTEIRLNRQVLKLKINQILPPAVTDSPSPTVRKGLPLSASTYMLLFSSSTYTSQIDPRTKIPSNKRIYAQVSSMILGNLIMDIKVHNCSVQPNDLQELETPMPFKLESCGPKGCNNIAKFSFSFDIFQDLPSNSWDIQCVFEHCTIKYCSQPELVKSSVQVIQVKSPTPNSCMEFGLPSILGIAFGGFLIGVLLISALWFIKIRTGYPAALGLGSTGTFLSGCPCTLTKRHPVPTNPSPSENSSANGSMGSTQSTPTSSMA